jgi:uncharacterized membrane protein YkvA (DUF1232 family)
MCTTERRHAAILSGNELVRVVLHRIAEPREIPFFASWHFLFPPMPKHLSWCPSFAVMHLVFKKTSGVAMFLRLLRLFRTVGRELVVLWYACRNPATPRVLKLGAVLLALYILSPVDLISDLLPVLGWVDDVTLLAFGIPALLKLVPERALRDAHFAAEGLLSRVRLWHRKS